MFNFLLIWQITLLITYEYANEKRLQYKRNGN